VGAVSQRARLGHGARGLRGIGALKVLIAIRRRAATLAILPALRGLLDGLAGGLLGVALPLTLFSGEHEIAEIVQHGAELGVATLLAIAAGKLLFTFICVGAGFLGGLIFPVILSGVAFGTALHLLAPIVPAGVCVLALVAGLLTAVVRLPVSAIVLLGLLSQPSMIPVIAIAAITSHVISTSALPSEAPQQGKTVAIPAGTGLHT
jgi:H+/Cl- antiporter ClcA